MMVLTEGVVDLAEYSPQVALTIVAEPEADRIEGMAEGLRKSLQNDFAISSYALSVEQILYPRQRVTTIPRTVIMKIHTQGAVLVDTEQDPVEFQRAGQWQSHEENGIRKAIAYLTQPVMDHCTATDLAVHAAISVKDDKNRVACHGAWTSKACASAKADFKPSSWKP
jgi:hypothetical protein